MRTLLHPAAITAVVVAILTGHAADSPVSMDLTLDAHRQLLLDDQLLASRRNVRRVVQQAEKFHGNPVIWPSAPWEPAMATMYGSVLREGDTFKAWYKSGMGVGYAESQDGVNWTKPRLDLTLLKGEPSNLLFTKKNKTEGPKEFPFFYELFGVHRDDREPDPARRYKMGFLDIDWKYKGKEGDPWHKGQRRGLGVAASGDGIHWKSLDHWATEAIVDGATHWMWDPTRRRYFLYGRTRQPGPGVAEAWATNAWFKSWFSGRAVARVESPNFLDWDFTRPGHGAGGPHCRSRGSAGDGDLLNEGLPL